jgi:deoxyuridine 5'-triphosphate nucleotidohydrolase
MKRTLKLLCDNEEVEELYRINPKKHKLDSGYDLICVVPPDPANENKRELVVPPKGKTKLKFGVKGAMTVSKGDEARDVAYWLVPRSSIYDTELMMTNHIGVIDCEYRGPIMAGVRNVSDQPQVVKHGDRLFQICHGSLKPFETEFVKDLSSTVRGAGGFGSTGKNSVVVQEKK